MTETMRRVELRVTTPRWSDKVRVHIVPLGLTKPVDVDLAVRQEPLKIVVDDTMPRFGLGRAAVTIGLPMDAADESVYVALTQANGSVAPANLWVKPQQPGQAVFWSGGPSRGQLFARAIGKPYADARHDVVYVWPIGFVVAVSIGALFGAIATMVYRKKSPKEARGVVAGAFVSGTVIAVAGSILGLKVASFDPVAGGGLALTFLLAAIGAWMGVAAFDLFGGTKGTTPASPVP
jgi:hypothetical protein